MWTGAVVCSASFCAGLLRSAARVQEPLHSVILVEAQATPAQGSALPPLGSCMSFRVTIQPSQRVFNVEPGETVLAAAMRNGIVLPYGCRNGACGACKGKVLEGTVDYGQYAAHILPDVEKRFGFALFCQARPLAN